MRYKTVTAEENDIVLRDRIHFVLNVARENNVDILLLGAFSCGAFKQNPTTVARYFKEFLNGEFTNAFETVVFPIPVGGNKNYYAFMEVFNED